MARGTMSSNDTQGTRLQLVYSHGTSELSGYHIQHSESFEQVLQQMRAALEREASQDELNTLIDAWCQTLRDGASGRL